MEKTTHELNGREEEFPEVRKPRGEPVVDPSPLRTSSGDSDEVINGGTTTPTSSSAVSAADSADETLTTNSQGQPVRKPRGSSKALSQSEREFFMKLEREWREEDEWMHRPSSWASTIFWMPVLATLRAFDMIFTLWFWPIAMIGSTFFGYKVKYAPFWDVPIERRKQTAVVLTFVLLLPGVTVAYFWSLILLIFPLTTFGMVLYYLFIFYWDKSAYDGSRRPFIRYWNLWRHFANYFPLRLIKTQNLDPTGKYVFAYHPHGVISIGAFGNFATDATGFSRKFPGIDLRLLTLEMNFWCPWIREVLLHMGVCCASKKACNQILRKGPGSAIMLVVGGAAESLETAPGTYRLTLGRKGFVRVALDNDADLVPVIGFGENDIFDTFYLPPDSWARRFQEKIRKKLGFAVPIFYGRGIFNYNLGILPHRKPIVVVVGKPIKLPRIPAHLKGSKLTSTAEGIALVDKYHEKYLKALRDLWDLYKEKWAIHRQGTLVINLNH